VFIKPFNQEVISALNEVGLHHFLSQQRSP